MWEEVDSESESSSAIVIDLFREVDDEQMEVESSNTIPGMEEVGREGEAAFMAFIRWMTASSSITSPCLLRRSCV